MGILRTATFAILAGLALLTLASGPALAQGTLFVVDDKVGVGTDTPTFTLHLRRDDGGGSGFRVETANSGTPSDWYFQANASTGAFLISNTAGGNSPFQLFPNQPKASFVLRSGGRVGIGTVTPQAKLDVNGAIYQRGNILHPDYVFEPDYELESIEDHSRFMWANRHLPAVGGGEYAENGQAVIDLGRRSQGMLEELEKAHIYIDQLHREIRELQDRFVALEARLDSEVGDRASRQALVASADAR